MLRTFDDGRPSDFDTISDFDECFSLLDPPTLKPPSARRPSRCNPPMEPPDLRPSGCDSSDRAIVMPQATFAERFALSTVGDLERTDERPSD